MTYENLYHLMVDAADKAVSILEGGDTTTARNILIQALMNAEDAYASQETVPDE